jgi:hypothetical protein
MLVLTPFSLCFVTLHGIFMHFPELTYLQDATVLVSYFSAVFVFQKSYTRNILRIGRNKSRTSYFNQSFAKTEDKTEGGQGPASPPGGAAQPLAAPTYGGTAWSTS